MSNFVYYNPNPRLPHAGDCTIRAISRVLGDDGWDWEKTYAALCVQGFKIGDMPSANKVWGSFLEENEFTYHSLMSKCSEYYSVGDFCNQHKTGKYVIGTDFHAIAVVDGTVYDSYDSRDMCPTYYFEKIKEDNNNG